jgi:hypothetical protein
MKPVCKGLILLSLAQIACSPSDPEHLRGDRVQTVELRDVQGLFGGRDVRIDASGHVQVKIVQPGENGLMERVYVSQIPRGRFGQFEQILDAHDFFSMETPDRDGVPDETRPAVTVTLASGFHRTVAKWAGDEHEDFDAIYAMLLDLGRQTAKPENLATKGPYNPNWTKQNGSGDASRELSRSEAVALATRLANQAFAEAELRDAVGKKLAPVAVTTSAWRVAGIENGRWTFKMDPPAGLWATVTFKTDGTDRSVAVGFANE